MKNIITCILASLSFCTLSAQTYWDVNTRGLPAKEELMIRYDENNDPVDTTQITYYADGKLNAYNQSILYGEGEERQWYKSTRTNHYRGDSLYMVISAVNGLDQSYEVIKKTHNKLFAKVVFGYFSELDAIKESDESSKIIFSYNTRSQLIGPPFQMRAIPPLRPTPMMEILWMDTNYKANIPVRKLNSPHHLK